MRRLIAEKLALALVTLAFVLTFNFLLFRAVQGPFRRAMTTLL